MPGSEIFDFLGRESLGDGLVVDESILVEGGRRELADEGSHSVLNIQEVRLDSRVEEPLEERTVEESDVGVGTDAGGRQLEGIPNQQHLRHSRLESDQQGRLRRLRCLVHDQTGQLSPQLAYEPIVAGAGESR